MTGKRFGLVELVEEARDRVLEDADLRDNLTVQWVADEVCRLCLGGQFHWAGDVSFPYDLFVPQELWPDLVYLDSEISL